MLIYANRFHGCCHSTLLSNETGEIFLLLPLSCKQPNSPVVPEQHGHPAVRWLLSEVDLLRTVGREAGVWACGAVCPVEGKTL